MNQTSSAGFDDSFFEPVNMCPWCGSLMRDESKRFSNDMNHYLTQLSSSLSLDGGTLVSNMKAMKCRDCFTSYLDPFIKKEILKNFFTHHKYSHKTGWNRFLDVVRYGERSQVYRQTLAKNRSLSKYLSSASKYIEVGCPFMGLLPATGTAGSVKNLQNTYLLHQENFVLENGYGTLQNKKVARLFLRIVKSSIMFSNFIHQKTRNTPLEVPDNRMIYMRRSNLIWSENCTGDQGLCSNVAKRNLGLELLSEQEFQSMEEKIETGNIFAFMNTLDHQDNPKNVFEEAIRRSRFVFVEIHSGGLVQKQHAFVLDETLLRDSRLIEIFDGNGKVKELSDFSELIKENSPSTDLLLVFKGSGS